MANIRAQVLLHTADNVPENFISNSWAFTVDSPAAAGANLTPILKAYYDSVRTYLSPVIAASGHEIKYTVLPGTPPNYPYDIDLWAFGTPPGGSAIPDEVSLCLSFQGTRGAGFPQARRRGRVYIGPFNSTALNGNRPAAALMTAMANAAITLKAAVTAVGGTYAWDVWSPTDGASTHVNNGWIDNAFDTQRRRGVAYTSRTTWA